MFKATIAKPNEPRVSSLARMIVEAVADYDYGTLIDYAAFKKIIFENPQANRGRAAILQAKKRLLRERNKLLVNVKEQGYRIVQPLEHRNQSNRLDARARQRQRRALDILVHCEESLLTPGERRQNEEAGLRLRLKLAIDKNISKATLQGTGANAALVIPSGKQLAKLLQQKPEE